MNERMTLRPHMRKVKMKDTSSEMVLRKMITGMNYRGYRVHYKKLPSKPDVVFTKRRKVIMMHGCFWHWHNCKAGRNIPATNRGYWLPKLKGNRQRDLRSVAQMRRDGWSVMVVWECQIKNRERTKKRIAKFLG